MGVDVIVAYEALVNNINELIDVSGYRNDYIAKKIGMTPLNFAMKKSRKSFKIEELKKIIQVIENEDTQDWLLLQQMRAFRDEETVTFEELEKEMKWK